MCKENKIPIVSFFTGGGFLDMGFEEAGFDVVFTNEFDKDFVVLYESGMKGWGEKRGSGKEYKITSPDSIVSLSTEFIEKEAFPEGKPALWGIIGGPPCQDFSINGNLKGFEGVRGKMTVIFFNKIRKMKPAFFLMENVTGLLKCKDHLTRLDTIIKNHCKEDYYLARFVLNALEYGVPQFRERVFMVGVKKTLFKPPVLENSFFDLQFEMRPPLYPDARKKYHWPDMNEFGAVITCPLDVPVELCVEHCLIKPEDREKGVANIDECFALKGDAEARRLIREGDTHRPSFKRLHRYRYSPTTCYGNNEVHLHPYENRRLSVREALRIQGVDDSYALPAKPGLSKKFKMTGNGVPVPLARMVAESLRDFVVKYYKDSQKN